MDSLAAIGTEVDLGLHLRKFGETEPNLASVIAAVGVVGAMTPDARWNQSRLTVEVGSLINIGTIGEPVDQKGFDLLTLTPDQTDFALPENYAAISGGGLWKLFFAKGGSGHVFCVQRRLIGTAFYQQHPRLVCHGPESIYKIVLPELDLRIEEVQRIAGL
ncbi:Peptidase M23B [Mesorhizobium loti]|nr:Peptidase M23B [Mesorhizobium loti]